MNLPEEFLQYTRTLMGEELFSRLTCGLATEPPVSIRLNPYKCSAAKADIPCEEESVPWCDTGLYLKERPNFTFDPLLHAGLYYVQEASSMFLHHVLKQFITEPVTMLDLCAAPGGKSTVARAALPEGSLLISNEPMRTRAQILSENIQKFGHPDVIVTNNYPADYKKTKLQFDVILTDVPCSGEGMFRKDEGAVAEWSAQNVDNCWRKQREIVSDIWECLKPGGLLIYSTCTFNAKEDEENVAWIASELGAEVLPVNISEEWNITGALIDGHPVYRFLPGKTKGEGLFMAVLRKHGEAPDLYAKDKGKKNKERNKQQKISIKPNPAWIRNHEQYEIKEQKDSSFIAISKEFSHTYDIISNSLKVIHAGIKLGELKGKDIIPDQSLALSIMLNPEAFPCAELTYLQAISYLRKEAVTLPQGTPTGFVLMTYKGIPLGFEKNIGNRANNLYPAEWKIKSTHIPDGKNEIIKI
jgi:16S rRNA C967 or C1407 C5-methylase (RsmB/RsmF family)/NOL1/NOP2/fmu family ribosome biogenesis protein